MAIITTIVVLTANLAKGSATPETANAAAMPILLVAVALFLLVVETVAAVCLGVKRYHDRDKSGWWVLIQLVPVIGPIWAIVELGFLPGTAGGNRYGPGAVEARPA